ncbi:hypothetical protein CXG81DRAFT_25417 [Caulochytrium protostelioides]|uniref:Uncharacterized protein n=1 Tax=Caulochytrium protostelioides TaxID=1555241 RepID=A0A4P9X9B8_9FUNG|nr:hypothetical protein CXG81DRAFT_25417 [Caulochytrium protostelioides]|eukprot:RKP01927.1 hypothetical protein CXG81DRAFT_25417 [Caulochytrium protostelioides]
MSTLLPVTRLLLAASGSHHETRRYRPMHSSLPSRVVPWATMPTQTARRASMRPPSSSPPPPPPPSQPGPTAMPPVPTPAWQQARLSQRAAIPSMGMRPATPTPRPIVSMARFAPALAPASEPVAKTPACMEPPMLPPL